MKLRDKLDSIESTLTEFRTETSVELAEIKKDLAYHILRTDILEQEIKPVRTLTQILSYATKILVAAAALVAALKGLGIL